MNKTIKHYYDRYDDRHAARTVLLCLFFENQSSRHDVFYTRLVHAVGLRRARNYAS